MYFSILNYIPTPALVAVETFVHINLPDLLIDAHGSCMHLIPTYFTVCAVDLSNNSRCFLRGGSCVYILTALRPSLRPAPALSFAVCSNTKIKSFLALHLY